MYGTRTPFMNPLLLVGDGREDDVESMGKSRHVSRSSEENEQEYLPRLQWGCAVFGVSVPDSPIRVRVVAQLVLCCQVAVFLYEATRLFLSRDAAIFLVNDTLNVLQVIIPLAFLQLHVRLRMLRGSSCQLTGDISAWIRSGCPGWKRWYVPVAGFSVLLLTFDFCIAWWYKSFNTAAFLLITNVTLWLPAIGGTLACFLVAAPFVAAFETVVARSQGSRGSVRESTAADTSESLRRIKRDIEALEGKLSAVTWTPNAAFIVPMALVSAVFMLDGIWAVVGIVYQNSDQFEDNDPDNYNALFFASEVVQEVTFLVALFIPMAFTNEKARGVALDVLNDFYCAPDNSTWAASSTAWLDLTPIGWKLATLRPSIAFIKGATSALISAAVLVLSRALF